MGGLQEWKKRAIQPPAEKGAGLEQTVRKQLAAAAGAEYFDNRDPVRHITEDFQKTFDLMGNQKAKARSGELFQTEMPSIVPGLWQEERREGQQAPGQEGQGQAGQGGTLAQQRGRESFLEQSSMADMVEPSGDAGQQMFLSRFAQVAFNRGTMASAVLRGSGKMMLFSCLKRTAGQSQPTNLRQRKLFEGSSQRRNVSGHPPDQVLFNRGEADGAVGLVVDVLRDARRVVDSMTELASGKNQLGEGSGARTLQKAYPFLSDAQEQALLAEYRGKLEAAKDPQSKAILQHAIVKTEALMEKKHQMKQRFIETLRSISDSANKALDAFTQPGFTEELLAMQGQEAAAAQPPPTGDGEDEGPEKEPERE